MRYRSFGRTGWQVSEIGYGAWQLGGTWGKVDDRESIESLHYAFDKGINFVDTAIAYGGGHSESVIGQALKQYSSERIYVTTKVPPLGATADTCTIKGRFPQWHIRESVEASLKRLGLERLDLLQLHLWYDDGLEELDWLETLIQLVKEGKVQYFGVSLPDIRPDQGVALAKAGIVSSQQVIYNIFEQEPAGALFRAAEKNQTAIIARVPFDSGALTGSWDENTYDGWADDDKRHLMYRDGRFRQTLERIAKIQTTCSPYYASLAEAAMRFSLDDPAVSTVVCGMRNRREVDMNTAYSDGAAFPAQLKQQLKAHAWKHQFYL